jgi:hypothetical protein
MSKGPARKLRVNRDARILEQTLATLFKINVRRHVVEMSLLNNVRLLWDHCVGIVSLYEPRFDEYKFRSILFLAIPNSIFQRLAHNQSAPITQQACHSLTK